MIYGPNGKPIHKPNSFLTPEWIAREMLDSLSIGRDYAVETRIAELRASVGVATGPAVGETVHVRLPKRFQ